MSGTGRIGTRRPRIATPADAAGGGFAVEDTMADTSGFGARPEEDGWTTTTTTWRSRRTAMPEARSTRTGPTSTLRCGTSSTNGDGASPIRSRTSRTPSPWSTAGTSTARSASATSKATASWARSSSRTRSRPSFLPAWPSTPRRLGRGRSWTAGGRACMPTTVGWPTSAPSCLVAVPVSRRSCSTTSSGRSPRSVGWPNNPVCSAAS